MREFRLIFGAVTVCVLYDIMVLQTEIRSLICEFMGAFVRFVESNYDIVEGIITQTVKNYKSAPDPEIKGNKVNLYIIFLSLIAVFKDCLGIELFNYEKFENVKPLFNDEAEEIVPPDYYVRDQFIDVTYKLIRSGKFIITELKDAHKNYPGNGIVLILDRKQGFLNFSKAALDMIAEMLPTVKDGDELAETLKVCKTIYCTDNGARQITITGKRTAFYSAYLSEFGDDILDIIDFCENEEFFFKPAEVPRNFVPVLWSNGLCAGFVLDGKGLPNPHINISGLSGMGKNRGAYKTAEGYWRLETKVIFLDVKGGVSEESLRDMKCDHSKFKIMSLKKDGFPFPLFNLSEFEGQNAKANYVLNVIGAAVQLTANQYSVLAEKVIEMISEDSVEFDFHKFYDILPDNNSYGLKSKLRPLVKLISAYTPKNNQYIYSSCNEFINDIR